MKCTIDDTNVGLIRTAMMAGLADNRVVALTKEGNYEVPLCGGSAALIDVIFESQLAGDAAVTSTARGLLASVAGKASKEMMFSYLGDDRAVSSIEIIPSAELGTQWIQLLPLGHVVTTDGREFDVSTSRLEEALASFEAQKNDIVVDYEHSTMLPYVEAPAAGWIEKMEIRADGLWALSRWTRKARSHIAEREYRYISPVVGLDPETREVVRILSVAVTNAPAMDGLMPLAAKNEFKDAAPPTSEVPDNHENKEAEMLEALAMGLGIQATEEAFRAKFEELNRELTETRAELVTATGNLVELSSAKAKVEAEVLVSNAIADGQIPAAQEAWAVNLALTAKDAFDELMKISPAGVYLPLQSRVVPDAAHAETKTITDESNREELHKAALSIVDEEKGVTYQKAVTMILSQRSN